MWIGEEAEVVLLCFVLILVTEVVAYIYFEEIMQHNNKNGKKIQNVASAKLPNVLLGARSASSSRDVMRLTMMRARPKQSFQFENTALHSCCFRGWFFRFVEPARPSESVPWCRHLDSRLESDSMNLTRAQSMLRHAFERKSSAHVRWEDANVHVTHFIPQSTSQKKPTIESLYYLNYTRRRIATLIRSRPVCEVWTQSRACARHLHPLTVMYCTPSANELNTVHLDVVQIKKRKV